MSGSPPVSMSGSPPVMSPAGSPGLPPQASPWMESGDVELTGLDEPMSGAGAPIGGSPPVAASSDVPMEPDLPKEPVSAMPEEPPEGEDALKVSFRMPSGQRTMRRFRPDDTVEVMFAVA